MLSEQVDLGALRHAREPEDVFCGEGCCPLPSQQGFSVQLRPRGRDNHDLPTRATPDLQPQLHPTLAERIKQGMLPHAAEAVPVVVFLVARSVNGKSNEEKEKSSFLVTSGMVGSRR